MNSSETLCATWIDDGACDVPAGPYVLVAYTPDWIGMTDQISIGGGAAAAITISQASVSCPTEATDADGLPSEYLECTATCEAGVLIDTWCGVIGINNDTPTDAELVSMSNGRCVWRSESSSSFPDTFVATARCLEQ